MSEEKIEKLTPEQEALIPVYREKWRKIALSTEPIDREKAAEAVKEAYALIKLTIPKIIFFENPSIAYKATSISFHPIEYTPITDWRYKPLTARFKNELQNYLKNIISKDIELNLWNTLKTEFHEEYRRMRRQLAGLLTYDYDFYNCIDNLFWLDYGSLFDFCISVLDCDYFPNEWLVFELLFKNCRWVFPFENTALICDRPRILSFDKQYRLHAEGAPAIQFADGSKLYAYHGVRLPKKYGQIHPNNWQVSWLLEEQNVELRRVLIQRIGYERIASELGATELDSFQEYSLLKIDTDIDIEPIYMLKMTCPSTGYIHVLRVPPYIKSARSAIRWVNGGVDPEEFAVQT